MFLASFKNLFQGYSSKIDECFDGELRVFQGSFKGIQVVSGVFWEFLKEVYRVFKVDQKSSKEVVKTPTQPQLNLT